VAGVPLASTGNAGWSAETADLRLTGHRRSHQRVSTDPLGDGPQLIVRRHGQLVGYCADKSDLAALGVDLSRMAVIARW
jgi:hypothetical protein